MTINELITALRRLKVETGSLACLGCGHEHNCDIHGCAIIREAAEHLGDFKAVFNEETIVRLDGRCLKVDPAPAGAGRGREGKGCKAGVNGQACNVCRYCAELKTPYERSDGVAIYGYCFKNGDKGYSPNMGKGYPIILPLSCGGTCKYFRRRRVLSHD